MLGIGKLTAGAEDYYLGVAQGIEDYYVGLASPGRWVASSQRFLRVEGDVDPEALRSVFAGHDPMSGVALVASRNRTVAAFGLTFKADKTVSLLHAFATPVVAGIVEDATIGVGRRCVALPGGRCVFSRRGRNGVEQVQGGGMVAAAFRHYRNRNQEPHLHDHVLVANMTPGPDGKWSTLDARHLYNHAKTAGYVYQSVMRHELATRLGIEFGPVINGVGSQGPRDRLLKRSRPGGPRSMNTSTPSARPRPCRAVRHPSDPPRERPTTRPRPAEWQQRARTLGFDPPTVGHLVGPPTGREPTRSEQQTHPDRSCRPTVSPGTPQCLIVVT